MTVQRFLERVILLSRWALVPFYIGLAVSLVMLLVIFCLKDVSLIGSAVTGSAEGVIVGVLSLVDLTLAANLVLLVIFVGWESFLAPFAKVDDRPAWIAAISYNDLKVKLLTSVIAIAAIKLLENFLDIDEISDRELIWSVGIFGAFVIASVALAALDRLAGSNH
jgi:uncharacterized protein (TIGR00645 family)